MPGLLATDAAVGAVASGQRGIVTLAQLLDEGLSQDAIYRRVRAGALIKMLPNVFRVAGAQRSWEQRAFAASVWAGHHAAVSCHAAAALHRLDGFGPPVTIDVLTTRPLRSRVGWVRVSRTPYWLDVDRIEVAGIAVTSAERALIELARSVREGLLEVAVEDALRRRLTSLPNLTERLSTLPANHPGRASMVRLLQKRGAAAPADSALEVKVIRLLRDWGYPYPVRQKVLDDNGCFVGRVDLVFPDRRLVIEVDGFRHHDGRAAFDHDRVRRNALTGLGWVVLHATHRMLAEPMRSMFARDLERAYRRPL